MCIRDSSLSLKRSLKDGDHKEIAVCSETTEVKSVQDFSGIRILLAEDNEINAEIVTVILENNGAAVDLVHNGKEAVERVKDFNKESFHLILMDIQMPVMDGDVYKRQAMTRSEILSVDHMAEVLDNAPTAVFVSSIGRCV